MCVRLSPSHPAARIVVGLYILLATFLIGFFVVQVTKSSLFSNTTIGQQGSVSDDIDLDNAPALDLANLLMTRRCTNADGILIWRWHDVPSKQTSAGTTIGITNNGTIQIHPGLLFVDSWAPDAGRAEYTRIEAQPAREELVWRRYGNDSFEQVQKPIEPSQTHSFLLSLVDDDRMVVNFDYKLGDDPTDRRVYARIPAGSQFAVTCF